MNSSMMGEQEMADIGAGNWNENDTNNNQPAPDGAPEGMSPSGVNDTIRAVMGALKRLARLQTFLHAGTAQIERDYEELKSELGLAHYEGRNWRGFHHHGTLCIAAYGFLIAERARFSPSAHVGDLRLRSARIPPQFRPRGAKSSSPTA